MLGRQTMGRSIEEPLLLLPCPNTLDSLAFCHFQHFRIPGLRVAYSSTPLASFVTPMFSSVQSKQFLPIPLARVPSPPSFQVPRSFLRCDPPALRLCRPLSLSDKAPPCLCPRGVVESDVLQVLVDRGEQLQLLLQLLGLLPQLFSRRCLCPLVQVL